MLSLTLSIEFLFDEIWDLSPLSDGSAVCGATVVVCIAKRLFLHKLQSVTAKSGEKRATCGLHSARLNPNCISQSGDGKYLGELVGCDSHPSKVTRSVDMEHVVEQVAILLVDFVASLESDEAPERIGITRELIAHQYAVSNDCWASILCCSFHYLVLGNNSEAYYMG